DRVTNGGTSTNTTGGGILLVNGQLNSGGILVTVGPPVVTAIAMNPVPDTTPLTMNLTAATAATLNIPFIATVSGTGFYNSAYTWSHVVNTMNGTPDATTFDNSTGVLTVGSGEKAGAASGETKSFTITITATSVGLNGGGVRETISKTFTFNITLP
ncbi:MAG: hypothetical protein LBG84_03025, partial [Treponema sp.]|nr:hypothetical protein [Treponema sp.]